MPEPAPIAVAVVEHHGQVLIGQRPPGVALAGYWEFPGGKIAPGESPQTAAVRECREETGLEIRIVGTRAVVEHAYEHGTVCLCFFAAELLDPEAVPVAPFRWVRRADLSQYRFPPANARVIAELMAE